MGLFSKLFCKHKWKTHEKKTYEYTSKEIVRGTGDWYHPVLVDMDYSDTVEILICEECGKITRLDY